MHISLRPHPTYLKIPLLLRFFVCSFFRFSVHNLFKLTAIVRLPILIRPDFPQILEVLKRAANTDWTDFNHLQGKKKNNNSIICMQQFFFPRYTHWQRLARHGENHGFIVVGVFLPAFHRRLFLADLFPVLQEVNLHEWVWKNKRRKKNWIAFSVCTVLKITSIVTTIYFWQILPSLSFVHVRRRHHYHHGRRHNYHQRRKHQKQKRRYVIYGLLPSTCTYMKDIIKDPYTEEGRGGGPALREEWLAP